MKRIAQELLKIAKSLVGQKLLMTYFSAGNSFIVTVQTMLSQDTATLKELEQASKKALNVVNVGSKSLANDINRIRDLGGEVTVEAARDPAVQAMGNRLVVGGVYVVELTAKSREDMTALRNIVKGYLEDRGFKER